MAPVQLSTIQLVHHLCCDHNNKHYMMLRIQAIIENPRTTNNLLKPEAPLPNPDPPQAKSQFSNISEASHAMIFSYSARQPLQQLSTTQMAGSKIAQKSYVSPFVNTADQSTFPSNCWLQNATLHLSFTTQDSHSA